MNDSTNPIRLQLVDDQALVRKAMAALLGQNDAFEVVGVSATLEDAKRDAELLQPQLLLLDIPAEESISETVDYVEERSPRTKIVLLDDAPLDVNAREVLRLGLSGYLSKDQPWNQVELALRQAARGERVFAPEIARRLVFSTDGVRLAVGTKDHPLASLTPREIDVLIYLAQGQSVKQCAKQLGIGASTAGNHKSRLMKKLDIHKTVELTKLAMQEGLIHIGRPTDRIYRRPLREADGSGLF